MQHLADRVQEIADGKFKEIIENLNSATFIIDKLQKGIDGKLTVGYDETSGPYISKYLQGFVAKYPDITVDIKKIQVSEEILALDNNEYDIDYKMFCLSS